MVSQKSSKKRVAAVFTGLSIMAGVPLVAAESFSFTSDETVTSNLVFGADATLDVAEGAAVTAFGTLSLGENASGDLTKTGAGTFKIATASINGTVNGGGAASLSVQGGTFVFAAPSGIANTFGDGVAIGATGALDVQNGDVTVGTLALDGGTLLVSGGSLTARNATGAADISVSGGGIFSITNSFTASSVATAKDGTRIDVTDGGVLAVKNMVAASGAEIALHVDGGIFRSLQYASGDAVSGGTVYVGERGMTIDVTDTYAWGPKWSMPISPEPGITDGGVDIVSFADTAPDAPLRIRFMDDCSISVAGGVRLDNVEAMLLGETYTTEFEVKDCAGVRAAISPTVTVDGLAYTGRNGYLVVGVSADQSVVTLLTAKKFTPPSQSLRIKFFRNADTSAVYPAGPADILKIPASVSFPLSRLSVAQNWSGYTFRFSERVAGSWRIIKLTPETQNSSTYLNPHSTDDWMTGTTPWLLNNATYMYEGGSRTVEAMMLLNPDSYRRNSMLSVPDGVNLSLAGGSQQRQGGFVKFGDGTLTFGGDNSYVFCHNFNKMVPIESGITQSNLIITNSSGVSARTHQSSLTVAAGTLTIGSGTDHPMVTVDLGEVDVGSATTSSAGTERDAAMVMESGSLNVLTDPLIVGRTHGFVATQSHTPLASSFTQNGGTVTVHSAGVAIDETAKSAMDARLVVNGGAFECRRELRLGMIGTSAAAESTATLEMNGGTLDIGAEAAARGVEGRLLAGTNSSANLSTVFTVNGGTVTLHAGALFAASGSHTVNLNEGGTIVVNNASFAANSGATASSINWDGGVMKFLGGSTLTGFKTVNVGEKGAIIDLSDAGTTCWFNQSLTGEGKLVVRGSGYQRGVQIYGAYSGCAGLVIESGGNVMVRDNPGNDSGFPIMVKDGGTLTAYYNRTYPILIFGESETDNAIFLGYYLGNKYYGSTVSGTLTVNGTVYVGYRETSYGMLVLPAGRHTLLAAPTGQIDASKFQIHPDLVARGAVATLSVEAKSASQDILVVDCTVDPSHSVWIAETSGAWETNSNWSLPPPGSSDDSVEFPSTLEEDITVTTDGARVRRIEQNSAHAVSIDGPIALPYGYYDIPEGDGVLELAGPVTIGTALISTRTSGAGTLRIIGDISGSPEISSQSGRIEGVPSAFGSAKLSLTNTTVRFVDSGVFKGQIQHGNADATGVGVDVAAGKVAYVTGALNNNSALQKLGPGKVVFCRTGTKASVTNFVAKSQKSQTTVPYLNGTNGDVPNGPPLGVYAGTIAFDGDRNTNYKVDGAVWVGFHPIADGTGGAYDANLDVYGGTLTVGSIMINRLVSADYDAVDKLGLARSPRSAINVHGGTLRVMGGFIMGYQNYVSSGISELNISGGLMEVLGTAETSSFGIGYHDSNVAIAAEELSSTINISGDGILRKVGTTTLCFGGYGGARTYVHNITLNMTGGRFEAPEAKLNLMNKNAKVHVNLCGGVLDVLSLMQTRPINNNGSSLDFHFSGGTYRPNAAESSFPERPMTSFTVGEGGAKFDLCEANRLTLNQALTTASGVAKDGGIELTAETAEALLTLNVANAFNGPLTVNGGTMKPVLAAAASCAAGVIVNDGGVFDANGMDFTFGYLRGNGGVYTNGTVTVTGAVEPVSGAVFVQNLVFGSGATLRCPLSGSAESGWSAPCLKVSGSVTAQGGVTLDLGGTESSPL